ncbi:MAG: M28 family peptidase [Phycisphaerae bacterium]|nr:M28 family peptidase [Phycisphaerae bacterium]
MKLLSTMLFFSVAFSSDPRALTDATNAVADARQLSIAHERLGSEPHVAGTAGDLRQIDRIAATFVELGLEVEVHRFHPLLARPLEASLEIVGELAPEGGRRGVMAIDLRERNLLEDPATAHADLSYGWNAYSGSGDVTGNVVYVNYGTRADFAKLAEMGIEVKGKIVLARYGGNFRGFKAKFAEAAGAAGLLIYTDPADAGASRGPVWPAGGWANDTCIQRGSILTVPWPGDPLTPGIEATADAKRLDVRDVALPTIPVQPIGYAAAERIIARMKGREVTDPAWKGGIQQTYRLEGGDELTLRLVVKQERFIGETANVVATLRGTSKRDEVVVVGCHHDAWGFGAADPLAGTIVLMESARSFAEAAKSGVRPERSIVFAAWGAEEFGIIGSTEWVESRRALIEKSVVAYVNLDMASMGDKLGISASPSLRRSIESAMRRLTSPFDGGVVFEAWLNSRVAPGTDAPIGDVGGGSDHVGFWCHAGVPSCTLGAGGSQGSSYHSNYDTVTWYRKTVGADYNSALLVTRACNALVAELANDPLPPVSPVALQRDAVRLVRLERDRAKKANLKVDLEPLIVRFEALVPTAERAESVVAAARARGGDPSLDSQLRRLLSVWIEPEGIPGRPWFRNLYAATDRSSGYAPAMLPLLTETIEDGDVAAVEQAITRYERVADELAIALDAIALGARDGVEHGRSPK